MYWTKAAITELDVQLKKHQLPSDQPLIFLTEQALQAADNQAREVHAADVRDIGEQHGPNIRRFNVADPPAAWLERGGGDGVRRRHEGQSYPVAGQDPEDLED